MFKSRHVALVSDGARAGALFLALSCAAVFSSLDARAPLHVSRAEASSSSPRAARQTERLDIRMRSFAPPASGHVTVEASGAGGRGRVTVLSLPDPQTVSPGARAYVVWAVSEGRIARLGQLVRDERGNGGLAFERPGGFDRYSVVVTAEATPDAERPGAPVLSTRANEATTLYPSAAEEHAPSADPAPAAAQPTTTTTQPAATQPAATRPTATQPPPAPRVTRARTLRAGDFYSEVDDAIATSGGGRVVEFEAARAAPSARGTARTATHAGSAYVRANFRGVPLPSAVGASVYVLWAIVADGRIIYMGSLPTTEDLNAAEIYVRTAGFGEDTFELFVTAERARPAPSPSDIKVLTPKLTSTTVR